MSTAPPPPDVPPAKLPEDLVEPGVRDRHDVPCRCKITESGLDCTRVALYDVVFEHRCIHTSPYPVCLPHRDLYEWACETQLGEQDDVGCFQCKPSIALGRLIEFRLLRDKC